MKILYTILIGAIIIMGIQGCATSHYYQLEPMEYSDLDYGYDVKYSKVRNINVAYIDKGSWKINTIINSWLRYICKRMDKKY